mgnify:CR=1 FL=1
MVEWLYGSITPCNTRIISFLSLEKETPNTKRVWFLASRLGAGDCEYASGIKERGCYLVVVCRLLGHGFCGFERQSTIPRIATRPSIAAILQRAPQ